MDAEYEELYKWIEEHKISRPKRNINRDFSDAIPLIEILKVHYPKLVEVHNYSPKNSFAQKIINWETLNNKVLKRIKVNLTKKRIEQLAKAEPGVIEKVLLDLKKKVESKDTNNDNYEILYLEGSPSSASKNGTTKKVITHAAFEKLQADLAEKTEAVSILKNKVDHLENLLNIKEERIKDLSLQLQTIVNQSSRPESGQGSKFFGFFQSANLVSDPIKNE
ncbi:sperm flagellar protein 1-like [Tribolium madens]|uniref:sperm flagellar protein 1-like n=1 Tax=Tribolium madens TaxID=41895 RepID=UPI001CF73A83|nr:sperm flagellar protein 1-like [Tribolium madens]